MKKVSRIKAETSIFFQCDIQAPKDDHYKNLKLVIENAKILNKAADLYNIPLIITEHLVEMIGYTHEELIDTYPKNHFIFAKSQFSAITEEVKKKLQSYKDRETIVLYGLETQVCVLQTALDLIEMGYNVFVVVDAVDSVMELDKKIALTRMKKAGVTLTTGDTVAWELLIEWPQNNPVQLEVAIELLGACKIKYKTLKKKKKKTEHNAEITPKL